MLLYSQPKGPILRTVPQAWPPNGQAYRPEPRMRSGRLHGNAPQGGEAEGACDRPGQAWLSVAPLSLPPHAPQAVQTRARRPRKTPKEHLWERLAIRSMRLEEVALVCFPAAPGASFALRVCFAFQQLPAVEGWLPSGPRSWRPRHFQTR